MLGFPFARCCQNERCCHLSDQTRPRLTSISPSLPLFRGPSGKIDVVTTRSEAFCQIRRFYHADRPLFRPKQGKGTTPGNRVNQARVAPGATQFLRDTIYAWADSVE